VSKVWTKGIIIGALVAGLAANIATIGKEPKPTTAGTVAWAFIIDVLLVWGIVSL
jgi:hypothetical protein